jgi:hypothetical protein
MDVVMMADQRNQAWNLLTFNVRGQHLMHSLKPRLRKTGHTHLQFLALIDWAMEHTVTLPTVTQPSRNSRCGALDNIAEAPRTPVGRGV